MNNPDTSPTPFAVLVHGDPRQSKSHLSAQKFIAAIYQSSKRVSQVFFYGEASSICGNYSSHADAQNQLQQKWLTLSKKHHFPLQACITTATNRGVVDKQESNETGKNVNLVEGFKLEGLGMLAEAVSSSCKLIEFGD